MARTYSHCSPCSSSSRLLDLFCPVCVEEDVCAPNTGLVLKVTSNQRTPDKHNVSPACSTVPTNNPLTLHLTRPISTGHQSESPAPREIIFLKPSNILLVPWEKSRPLCVTYKVLQGVAPASFSPSPCPCPLPIAIYN